MTMKPEYLEKNNKFALQLAFMKPVCHAPTFMLSGTALVSN